MSDKSKKPDLFLINTTPIDDIPVKSFNEFTQMLLSDGMKPSVAIRSIMKKYNCPNLHDTTVIHFLERAYPNIDFGRKGFRFNVVDSAYPNSDPKQFNDKDFDDGIEELLSLPPIEY